MAHVCSGKSNIPDIDDDMRASMKDAVWYLVASGMKKGLLVFHNVV